jgi:hypothetical protein
VFDRSSSPRIRHRPHDRCFLLACLLRLLLLLLLLLLRLLLLLLIMIIRRRRRRIRGRDGRSKHPVSTCPLPLRD